MKSKCDNLNQLFKDAVNSFGPYSSAASDVESIMFRAEAEGWDGEKLMTLKERDAVRRVAHQKQASIRARIASATHYPQLDVFSS